MGEQGKKLGFFGADSGVYGKNVGERGENRGGRRSRPDAMMLISEAQALFFTCVVGYLAGEIIVRLLNL